MASRTTVMYSEDEFRRHFIALATARQYHVTHIESHMTSAGVPDLNLFKYSRDCWIELKVVKDGKIRLRPTQKRWHRERAQAGGRSWVVVLDRATDTILWVSGDVAVGLGPAAQDWRAVSNILPVAETAAFLDEITYGV